MSWRMEDSRFWSLAREVLRLKYYLSTRQMPRMDGDRVPTLPSPPLATIHWSQPSSGHPYVCPVGVFILQLSVLCQTPWWKGTMDN